LALLPEVVKIFQSFSEIGEIEVKYGDQVISIHSLIINIIITLQDSV